jgi:hypothetical protein
MALSRNQLTAMTENVFIPKVADGVYNTNPLIKRWTQSDKLMLKDGGLKIIQPIIKSIPMGSGKFYSGYETLDSDPTDDVTAAEYDWKMLESHLRISQEELLKNSGDSAKVSLIATKASIMQKTMLEFMASGLYSDGTAATGMLTTKQITGLGAILSTTSTYGNLAVADFPEWVATVLTHTTPGTSRALSLYLLQTLFGTLSYDGEKPGLGLLKQDLYNILWSQYQPHQRLMSEEMSSLGFKNILEFNGIPMIVDSHMESGAVYMLNENHVFMCVHKDRNLVKQTFEKLETTDSMLYRLYWMGNLICSNRRFQGKLDDLAITA